MDMTTAPIAATHMTSRIHAGCSTWKPILAIIGAAVVVAGAWAGLRHDAWAGAIAAALLVLALAGWFFSYDRHVRAKESEEQYRILFNNSSDAVVVFGLGEDGAPTNFIQVNDMACQRLGYTREELLERSPRDVGAPGTSGPIMQHLLAGDQSLFETEHLTRDGRRIPTEINARAFLAGDQRMVLGVGRDITERKRMEKDLRMIAAVVENSTDFIGLASLEGSVLFLNPAARQMLGFDGDEPVTGGSVPDDFMDEDREWFRERVLPAVTRDGRWEGEARFKQIGRAHV